MNGEPRIWKDVLVEISGWKRKFTAGDVADAFDMPYANAAQLLKRLQTWSHLRLVGFQEAVHENPKKSGRGGRRRKVYEVTDAGRKKVEWIKRSA